MLQSMGLQRVRHDLATEQPPPNILVITQRGQTIFKSWFKYGEEKRVSFSPTALSEVWAIGLEHIGLSINTNIYWASAIKHRQGALVSRNHEYTDRYPLGWQWAKAKIKRTRDKANWESKRLEINNHFPQFSMGIIFRMEINSKMWFYLESIYFIPTLRETLFLIHPFIKHLLSLCYK